MDDLLKEEELGTKKKRGSNLLEDNSDLNLSEEEINIRIADFYESLAKSGGKLYEVSKYPINDRKSVKNDFCGYGVKTIPIVKWEIKKSFFLINGELELLIARTRLAGSNGPWYFYNKDEAYDKAENLTTIELRAVESKMEQTRSIMEDLEMSKSFLDEILQNKTF